MSWGSIIGGGLGAAGGFLIGGPVGAGIGMGLGAGLGGAIEGEFADDAPAGGGAQTYQPVYVDPDLYKTDQFDSYYRDIGRKEGAYADRSGPSLDWEMANRDREMALAARTQQEAISEEYRRAASGQVQSVAEQQMRQGLTAANADALQVAASTRGGGGNILLAQQQAQAQGAANALATQQQAAMLRAQETAQAREGWAKSVANMRGQDLEMRGGSQQQARAEADVALAARAQNDAMVREAWAQRMAAAQGAAQTRANYGSALTGTQQNAQNLSAQSAMSAAERAAAAANAKAARDAQMVGGMMTTGGQIAAMGMQAEEGAANRENALKASGYYGKPGAPAPGGGGGGGPVVISGSSDHSYGDPWGQGASTYTPGSGSSGGTPAPDYGEEGPKKPGAYYGGMGGDRDSSGDPYGYGYGDDKWP